MEADKRREWILQFLRERRTPVSASALARELGVSRQAIVGDIALLRAEGNSIVATARGYTMQPVSTGRYVGKIACQHSLADTRSELLTIVRQGGEILDVVVEHYLYGEITGQLNIATLADVDAFIGKLIHNKARLLSELTGGAHLHTVACRDAEAFASIKHALAEQGFLYGNPSLL